MRTFAVLVALSVVLRAETTGACSITLEGRHDVVPGPMARTLPRNVRFVIGDAVGLGGGGARTILARDGSVFPAEIRRISVTASWSSGRLDVLVPREPLPAGAELRVGNLVHRIGDREDHDPPPVPRPTLRSISFLEGGTGICGPSPSQFSVSLDLGVAMEPAEGLVLVRLQHRSRVAAIDARYAAKEAGRLADPSAFATVTDVVPVRPAARSIRLSLPGTLRGSTFDVRLALVDLAGNTSAWSEAVTIELP